MTGVDGQQLQGQGIAETMDVDVEGTESRTGESGGGVGIEGAQLEGQVVPKEAGRVEVCVFSRNANASPVEISRRNLGCLHSSR